MRQRADRPVEICVTQHDGGVLAAHLHAGGDPALGALHTDGAARPRRPREDARVEPCVDQRRPGAPVAVHHAHETRRKLSGETLDEPRARARRVLRRLDDDAVAREKSGPYGPVEARDREVPRRDDADDAPRDIVDVSSLLREGDRIEPHLAPRGPLLDDAGPAPTASSGPMASLNRPSASTLPISDRASAMTSARRRSMVFAARLRAATRRRRGSRRHDHCAVRAASTAARASAGPLASRERARGARGRRSWLPRRRCSRWAPAFRGSSF